MVSRATKEKTYGCNRSVDPRDPVWKVREGVSKKAMTELTLFISPTAHPLLSIRLCFNCCGRKEHDKPTSSKATLIRS